MPTGNHTPGPWFDCNGIICRNGDERGYPVAEMVKNWFEDGYAADSQLICAAPEMLEVLRNLYEHCAMVHKHWGDGDNRKEADAAIKAGAELLKKLTGGEVES